MRPRPAIRPLLVLLLVGASCARSDEGWAADLRDEDPARRALAAAALGRAGPERARAVLPDLLACLADPDLEVSAVAERSLVQLGGRDPRALLEALPAGAHEDEDARAVLEEIARVHADALARALVAHLRDQEGLEPAHAAGLLLLLPEEPRLAALRRLAADDDPEVRSRAMRVASALVEADERAFELVLEGVRDPSASVRASALAAVLEHAGRPGAAAALEVAARDPAGEQALGGARFQRALALLAQPSPEGHRAALDELAPLGAEGLRELAGLLDGADHFQARLGARGLQLLIGSPEHPLAGALSSFAGSAVAADRDARALAWVDAARRVPSTEVAAAAVEALGDEAASVRCAAALALAAWPERPAGAEPALRRAADLDPVQVVRQLAHWALSR